MPHRLLYHLLDPQLWAAPFARRSLECTPLYISRYNGPRRNRALTSHPFWELTAVVSGSGELQGRRTTDPLLPGTVVLVPPGWVHREHSVAGLDTIWIGCRGTRFRDLPRRPVQVRDPRLVSECERLWLFAQRPSGKIGAELDAGVTAVVSALLRASEPAGGAPCDDIIDGIIRHMHEHIAEPLRVADLARRAGCSEGHLSRIFRRRTGQSPVRFLSDLRLKQAAHLLEQTGLRVSEIAERVGFGSLFYLSRVFGRRVGLSPRAYRQRMARGHGGRPTNVGC